MVVLDFLTDFILLPLFIYLLHSLIRSKEEYLGLNFYFFFFTTGIFEIISAVAQILLKSISFSTEQAWVYTILISFRHIGEMGATIGKLFNINYRYHVMSGGTLCEIQYWPIDETMLQIVLPILSALHLCDYLSAANGLKIMNGTSRWFLYQGILNIITYSTFIFLGTGMTAKGWIEFKKAQAYNQRSESRNSRHKKALRYYKRMMEATASVCFSHSFKALYHILVGVLAILDTFGITILLPYMDALNIITNGLSMYVTPLFLVIFSRSVRRALRLQLMKAIDSLILVKKRAIAKMLKKFSREQH